MSENYPEATNGDIYLNPYAGDLWVVDNRKFVKINDGRFVDIDDPVDFIKVGHIDNAIINKTQIG